MLLPALISIGQMATASLPFDSIANPLLTAASGTNLQLAGDQANQAISRVRVNQAGYRLADVRKGQALFQVLASGTASEATLEGPGGTKAVALRSRGFSVSGQVVSMAFDSGWAYVRKVKAGYPLTSGLVSGTLHEGTLPADLVPGRYVLRFGSEVSAPFTVSPDVYGMVRDAALMFFGVQRSGDGSSWFHGPSHLWDGWLFDTTAKNADGSYRYKGALSGGWYQDGSHLKGARTQGFALAMLGTTAATLPTRDKDHFAFDHSAVGTDGIPDMVREMKWGADFALKAWKLSGGQVRRDALFLSVGDLNKDFGWWGRAEEQDDSAAAGRGNRKERTLVADWGSPALSDWAAGLAFAARLWKPYDQGGWCDSALTVAKAFYAAAKSLNIQDPSSMGYSSDFFVNDDLALAATALLWATGENAYLQDLAYTAGMPTGKGGTCGASPVKSYPGLFEGGFLGCGVAGIRTSGVTGLADVHMPVLHAFHKLILKDSTTAMGYGLGATERALLEEKTLRQMIAILAQRQGKGSYATLPSVAGTNELTQIGSDSLWGGSMPIGTNGWWGEYQAGSLLDLALYLDATGDVLASGTVLPNLPNADWKRDSVNAMLVRGTGALLGMNQWDLSMVQGVGAKNPMHIHHRDANPEQRNDLRAPAYAFRMPIGALLVGTFPFNSQFTDATYPVGTSESSLPGSAVLVMLATQLSQDTSTVAAPVPTGVSLAKSSIATGFTVRAAGDQMVLTRKGTAPARLELLDPNGAVLSSQDWTGATLRIGRANALRVARLVSTEGTVTHLLAP